MPFRARRSTAPNSGYGCGTRNLNPRPSGSVGDGKGSPQPIAGRTLAHRTPRSSFCSRHSSAFFRVWLESLGCEGEAGFIYAHMTSQNLHEMLTQLYLELGLSLQDALRAAEADLRRSALVQVRQDPEDNHSDRDEGQETRRLQGLPRCFYGPMGRHYTGSAGLIADPGSR